MCVQSKRLCAFSALAVGWFIAALLNFLLWLTCDQMQSVKNFSVCSTLVGKFVKSGNRKEIGVGRPFPLYQLKVARATRTFPR